MVGKAVEKGGDPERTLRKKKEASLEPLGKELALTFSRLGV